MNNIRKFLIKSFTVLVLLLVASTAFAASGETIIIGGAVPLELNLTVTPTADADNLVLVGTTSPNTVAIASIAITTNNTAGWDLIIISENDATLTNADSDDIAYTLLYAGIGAPVATAPTSGAGVKYGEEADASGDTADLSIIYAQSTTHPAGYYSDQLSIVLRAK